MNHSEYPSVAARTAKESLFRCGRGGVAAAAGWLTQPFWPCRIESPTGMNLEPSAEANEGKNRSSCLWGIHFSPPALGLNPSLSDSTKTCDFLPPPSVPQHHSTPPRHHRHQDLDDASPPPPPYQQKYQKLYTTQRTNHNHGCQSAIRKLQRVRLSSCVALVLLLLLLLPITPPFGGAALAAAACCPAIHDEPLPMRRRPQTEEMLTRRETGLESLRHSQTPSPSWPSARARTSTASSSRSSRM